MFGKRSLVNGVVFLVVFGFAMGFVADSKSKSVHTRIDHRDTDIVVMSVALDGMLYERGEYFYRPNENKTVRVDKVLLTDLLSSAVRVRYGEKVDEVTDVYFALTRGVPVIGSTAYWGQGVYYELERGIEYLKMPVRLRLKMGEEVVLAVPCQWEVSFQADEGWKNISVNTMRVSSCSHPQIDFTSNVFVDILSERLDDVFVYPVYPDIETEIQTEEKTEEKVEKRFIL